MIKIAVWSGPRNISTALMRSFGNRMDTFVSDEPLYGYFLYNSHTQHPMKEKIIQSMDVNLNSIINYLSDGMPSRKPIWYQKHMAHHILSKNNMEWICKLKNVLLIRHPKKVISSYIKKNKLTNILQLGCKQQNQIFNFLKKRNKECIIIDANDILNNPKKILLKLCKKVEIPFNEKMLRWKKGVKKYDGIWGTYWYHGVVNSNGFKKPLKIQTYDLQNKYVPILKEAMIYYEKLFKHRIR